VTWLIHVGGARLIHIMGWLWLVGSIKL